jgi:transposase-like protein
MKHYSEVEKMEIVLAALRNEASKAELCRQRGIAPMSLDGWIKRFIEGEKVSLSSQRTNGSGEVEVLRKENDRLKRELSERELDVRILKKVTGQM